MIPEEVFKRRPRHNNTPDSIILVIANYIVVALSTALFTDKEHISLFFWVVIAILAWYNYYTIRRNIEEFSNRVTLIAYIVNICILVGLFFLFRDMA
jgi:hypothetical protein